MLNFEKDLSSTIRSAFKEVSIDFFCVPYEGDWGFYGINGESWQCPDTGRKVITLYIPTRPALTFLRVALHEYAHHVLGHAALSAEIEKNPRIEAPPTHLIEYEAEAWVLTQILALVDGGFLNRRDLVASIRHSMTYIRSHMQPLVWAEVLTSDYEIGIAKWCGCEFPSDAGGS